MVERQTPNLRVGGSNPSWPAKVSNDVWISALSRVGYMAVKDVVQFLREVRVEFSRVYGPSLMNLLGQRL